MKFLRLAAAVSAASMLAFHQPVSACTRVVYHGEEERILTARSMDWKDEIGTNLWVLPRGMKR